MLLYRIVLQYIAVVVAAHHGYDTGFFHKNSYFCVFSKIVCTTSLWASQRIRFIAIIFFLRPIRCSTGLPLKIRLSFPRTLPQQKSIGRYSGVFASQNTSHFCFNSASSERQADYSAIFCRRAAFFSSETKEIPCSPASNTR